MEESIRDNTNLLLPIPYYLFTILYYLLLYLVWKTVPPRAKHPHQSYKSVFEKKLSGETNTDYKDITDFIKW